MDGLEPPVGSSRADPSKAGHETRGLQVPLQKVLVLSGARENAEDLNRCDGGMFLGSLGFLFSDAAVVARASWLLCENDENEKVVNYASKPGWLSKMAQRICDTQLLKVS